MIRPPQRRTVAALTLSAAALVGIVLHEGYTDRAVIPVKGDVPTIGFGTTTGVKLGDTTTPPKALARALTDVADGDVCFITSANLTGHAMEQNMEAGVLLTGGQIPKLLLEHLQALVDTKTVSPV
jgi:hypothetical protein